MTPKFLLTTCLVLLISMPMPVWAQTSLIQAIDSNDTEAVEALLMAGANPIRKEDGRSPILAATQSGDQAIITMLLKNGADVNDVSSQGTPLHVAVRGRNTELVTFLLAHGANPGLEDRKGETAFHWAILNEDLDTIKRLIQYGADVNGAIGQGTTPLMLAAMSPHAELVTYLLNHGANLELKDQAARTAIDYARAANQADNLGRIEAYATGLVDIPESAIRPDVAEVLTRVSHRARDGDVIVLSAGEFKGQIQVTGGKHLRIVGDPSGDSVLVGPDDSNVVIYVDAGGTIELENLKIGVDRPIPSEIGVFIKDGTAHLNRVHFSGQLAKHVYAEGGEVHIQSCTFKAPSSNAIDVEQTELTIRDSEFEACPVSAVYIRNGVSCTVTGTRFQQSSQAIFVDGGSPPTIINQNHYQMDAVTDRYKAFSIKTAGPVTITGNQLNRPFSGIDLISGGQGNIAIARNGIRNPELGIRVSVESETQPEYAGVSGNLILNSKNAGIAVSKIRSVVAANNTIIAGGNYGMAVLGAGSANILFSSIISPEYAIIFQETDATASRIHGVQAAGEVATDGPGFPVEPAMQRFFHAAVAGSHADALKKLTEEIVTRSEDLNADNLRDYINTMGRLVELIDEIQDEADGMATVNVRIADRSGEKRFVPLKLYHATGGGIGHINWTAYDFRNPQGFLNALRSKSDPVSIYIFNAFPDELKDWMNGESILLNGHEIRSMVLATLNDLMTDASLYEAGRFGHVELHDETTALIRNEERSDIQNQRMNRHLIEDAYPDFIYDSHAFHARAQNETFIMPGRYWVDVRSYGFNPFEIVLEPGENRILDLTKSTHQWLTIDQQGPLVPTKVMVDGVEQIELWPKDKGTPPHEVLMPLKHPGPMQAAVSRIVKVDLGPVAMQRPGLAPDIVTRQVQHIRDAFEELTPTTKEPRAIFEYQLRRKAIARVLGAYGNASDIRDIVEHCKGTPADWRLDEKIFWTRVIAYMETRLGRLDEGMLVEIANGSDPDWATIAGMYLHVYGSPKGKPVLVKFMKQANHSPEIFSMVAWAVLDISDPDILAGMRRRYDDLVSTFNQIRQWTNNRTAMHGGVLLYLLTYGEAEDWQKISRIPFSSSVVQDLVFICADPSSLAKYPHDNNIFYGMLSALRDVPSSLATKAATAFEDAVLMNTWRRNIKPGDSGIRRRHYGMMAHNSKSDYRGRAFYWRPRGAAGKFYGAGVPYEISEWFNWVSQYPPLGTLSTTTEDKGILEFSDYMSPEKLVGELEKLEKQNGVAFMDDILASHRLTTAVHINTIDNFDDGIDRRAYDTIHPGDEGGVVVGPVELQLRQVANTLQIRCEPKFSIHMIFEDTFGPTSSGEGIGSSKMYPYLSDNSSQLISGVSLRRGNTTLPLKPMGRLLDGSHLFEAEINPGQYQDLYFDLELTSLGRSRTLTFDLFASRYANQYRKWQAQLKEKLAYANAHPDNVKAWQVCARLFEAVGQISKSVDAWQRVTALEPGNSAAAIAVAEMYRRIKQYDKGIEFLTPVVKQEPGNPANWYDLAGIYFLAGKYADAEQTASNVLMLNPAHDDARALAGMSAFMQNRHAEAVPVLFEISDEYIKYKVLPVLYFSSRMSGIQEAAVTQRIQTFYSDPNVQKEEKQHIGLLINRTRLDNVVFDSNSPNERCRAYSYAGLLQKLAGRPDRARAHFEDALRNGNPAQWEYRLAEREVGR